MERFRDCFYRPFLTNSDNFERWTRLGAKDSKTRAGEIYKKKLEDFVAPEMDPRMRQELDEFVAMRKSQLD
jgi:trimethylamine--corrinoid protein Co-methyltransferase